MEHCFGCAPGLRASQPSRYSLWGMGRIRLSGSRTGTRARGLHLVVSGAFRQPALWLGNLETRLLAVDFQCRCRTGETGYKSCPPDLTQSAVSYSYTFALGRPKTTLGCHRQLSFTAPKSEVEGGYIPLRCLLLRRGMVGFGGKKWGQTKAWGSVHFLYIQTANQI